jgi:hypothetical protein
MFFLFYDESIARSMQRDLGRRVAERGTVSRNPRAPTMQIRHHNKSTCNFWKRLNRQKTIGSIKSPGPTVWARGRNRSRGSALRHRVCQPHISRSICISDEVMSALRPTPSRPTCRRPTPMGVLRNNLGVDVAAVALRQSTPWAATIRASSNATTLLTSSPKPFRLS